MKAKTSPRDTIGIWLFVQVLLVDTLCTPLTWSTLFVCVEVFSSHLLSMFIIFVFFHHFHLFFLFVNGINQPLRNFFGIIFFFSAEFSEVMGIRGLYLYQYDTWQCQSILKCFVFSVCFTLQLLHCFGFKPFSGCQCTVLLLLQWISSRDVFLWGFYFSKHLSR